MCDTDVAFVDNIEHLLDPTVIQAKYVDTATPDLEILRELVKNAGLPSIAKQARSTSNEGRYNAFASIRASSDI